MADNESFPLNREMERVRANEEEAIVFLAEIIPKKDKEWIRKEIESTPRSDFVARHGIFFGLKTRNALRAGGFFYLPSIMEVTWFHWLKKAVYLPEDKIILTDSIKERIKKYRAATRKPPLRPELDPAEIQGIKEQLGNLHKVKLPEIQVRYGDNLRNALSIKPIELPRFTPKEIRRKITARRNLMLKLKGVRDEELIGLDISRFTIFLRRRYVRYPAGLYGAVWHEMGHALAFALNIREKNLNEGIAYACGFRGLLMSAKQGKISPEEAVDQIEHNIKSAKSSFPFLPHRWALRTIEANNPDLNFRNRNLDELIAELDRSIQEAVDDDVAIRKHTATQALKGSEEFFIIGSALTILALQILSYVL